MCVECVQGQILRVNLKSVYTKTQCQFPPETDRLGERERESKRERERESEKLRARIDKCLETHRLGERERERERERESETA